MEIHPADVDLLHLLVVYGLVRDFTTEAPTAASAPPQSWSSRAQGNSLAGSHIGTACSWREALIKTADSSISRLSIWPRTWSSGLTVVSAWTARYASPQALREPVRLCRNKSPGHRCRSASSSWKITPPRCCTTRPTTPTSAPTPSCSAPPTSSPSCFNRLLRTAGHQSLLCWVPDRFMKCMPGMVLTCLAQTHYCSQRRRRLRNLREQLFLRTRDMTPYEQLPGLLEPLQDAPDWFSL